MSDHDDHEHGVPEGVHFMTPEDMQRMMQEMHEQVRLQHEELHLSIQDLFNEATTEQLETLCRLFAIIADSQDQHGVANFYQGLANGTLGHRRWRERQEAPLTVPEEFSSTEETSVAYERFGPHSFIGFEDSLECAKCGTPQENRAHTFLGGPFPDVAGEA